MNDWISWSASMHFCSISNVQLLQPSRGPGYAHGHTDTLVHRWGRRPFHATQQRGPQTPVQQRSASQRPDMDRDECLSLPAACPHCWRMTEKKAMWTFPLRSQGHRPLATPFELILSVSPTFFPRVHLAVPWVVLALSHARCGGACSSGSAGSPVPAFSDSTPCSSRAPPHSLVGVGLMSMAGDGQGNCECPLMLGTNVPSADICNHLAPMPTSRKRAPLARALCQHGRWACVSAAKGPQRGSK